jgi:hypothetical protein
VIDWVVAPVDQKLSVGLLEVRITLSVEQNVVGPSGVIVGVAATVVVMTVTRADVSETQSPLSTYTQ